MTIVGARLGQALWPLFHCVVVLVCWMLAPGTAEAGPQVGVLMPAAGIPYYLAIQRGVEAELAKIKDLQAEMLIERPSPNEMAWRNATRRLLVLESSVILAYGGGAARAVMSEAPNLPLVFSAAFDPAPSGIVGANVTGVAAKAPLFTLVKALKDISHYRRLGILFSSSEADSVRQAEIVATLAGEVIQTDVTGLETILFPDDIQAVFLTCAGAVQNEKAVAGIVERARAGKIATASVLGEAAGMGILVTMSVPADEMARKTAKAVADILSGAKISGIPQLGSRSQAELIVNEAEARALGFSVPAQLSNHATILK